MRKRSSFLICDLLDDSNCDRRRNDDFGQSPVSSESSYLSHDHRFNCSIATCDRIDAITPDLKPIGHFDDNLSDDKSESSSSKKNRKSRTIFTDKQLQALEECFDKQKYLSVQDRLDLARRLRLSDTQVKTWYQNRRTKWKRQSAVGYELLNEAANCMAVQQILQTNPGYWSYLAAAGALNPGDCPPPGSLLPTTIPCAKAAPSTLPQHTSFCFYPPTEENHYPTVAMPPPVKSILTVDNTVATSLHC